MKIRTRKSAPFNICSYKEPLALKLLFYSFGSAVTWNGGLYIFKPPKAAVQVNGTMAHSLCKNILDAFFFFLHLTAG